MFAHFHRITIFIAALGIALASAARADEQTTAPAPSFSESTTQRLLPFRYKIEAAQEMIAAGEITQQQGQAATRRYLTAALDVAGTPLLLEQLLALEGTPVESTELTGLQKLAGLATAVNIAWVVAGILVLVAVVLLFTYFLSAGPTFWEVVLYIASSAFLYAAWRSSPGVATYLAFTGAATLAGALGFTWTAHGIAKDRSERTQATSYFATVMAFEAILALALGNAAIGFLAVMALMGALGFSVAVIPFGYAVGFENEKVMARATNAAFAILVGFVLLKALGQHTPLAVFETGAYFMGAFVGYLGLLIMASKWYDRSANYALMQFVMIVAGVSAIIVGSILHIGELQKIGGTFLGLYAIEKLTEIPVESKEGVAILCLVIAAALTAAAWMVKTHLDFFAPFLIGI
ncbi:MAG: hypothetical protein Q7S02_04995 [bacterium]|nr:hypothetical protein [bacterium]